MHAGAPWLPVCAAMNWGWITTVPFAVPSYQLVKCHAVGSFLCGVARLLRTIFLHSNRQNLQSASDLIIFVCNQYNYWLHRNMALIRSLAYIKGKMLVLSEKSPENCLCSSKEYPIPWIWYHSQKMVKIGLTGPARQRGEMWRSHEVTFYFFYFFLYW